MKEAEGEALPFWAAVAFTARCARRYADIYATNGAEPASARVAVLEAVGLAEQRASRGGQPEFCWMEIDGQYFDNYDIKALDGALGHYAHAADNTLTDLQDCVDGGPLSRRNLAAIELAQVALAAAFPEDLGIDEPIGPEKALELVRCGNEGLLSAAEADLALALRLSKALGWSDGDGVPPDVFEPLGSSVAVDVPSIDMAVEAGQS